MSTAPHRKTAAPAPVRVPARVWSGGGWLALARLWGALTTAAAFFVLARTLPPEEFGRTTFYLALFVLFDTLTDFGTGAAVLQRGGEGRTAFAAALAAARRARLVLAGAGWSVLALGVLVFRDQQAGWILLAGLFPFTRVLESSSLVFQQAIAWRVPVATRAIGATTRLGLVLFLTGLEVESGGAYVLAHAAGGSVGHVLVHLAARRRLPRRVRPLPGFLRLALPLGLAGACQQAYLYVDNLFVRGLCGAQEVGRYNAAVRVASFLTMFAVYATTAALPWLARRQREQTLGAAVVRLAQPLFAAGALGVGLLLPWSDELCALLFGEGFRAAGASLRWLLLSAAVVCAGAPLLTGVVAAGASRSVLRITAGALGVNLVGNALLVPLLAAEGAALATLVTEIAVLVGAWSALAARDAAPRGRPLGWTAGALTFVLGGGIGVLLA